VPSFQRLFLELKLKFLRIAKLSLGFECRDEFEFLSSTCGFVFVSFGSLINIIFLAYFPFFARNIFILASFSAFHQVAIKSSPTCVGSLNGEKMKL